ncbi:hypothetical protein [Methylobacter sp.]|uniref:hypothetical protein n=1 Tax=Methylobacter sp. TaxID=2051955 RepID=UPI0011F61987|nr:hypothetical protein [Methylobacter sp.]TAK59559.1 MAG: hypothetical protein EPO18_20575 [Methylobacter sp.]
MKRLLPLLLCTRMFACASTAEIRECRTIVPMCMDMVPKCEFAYGELMRLRMQNNLMHVQIDLCNDLNTELQKRKR